MSTATYSSHDPRPFPKMSWEFNFRAAMLAQYTKWTMASIGVAILLSAANAAPDLLTAALSAQ